MRTTLVFLFAVLHVSAILPQQFTGWKNYTDMKDIRAVKSTSDGLWAATSGGAFSFNPENSGFQTLHKINGLRGASLTSLAIDQHGKIWFGSATGIIDVYNPQTGTFRTILDIFNSDRVNKSINDIRIEGDTVFISTGFGVTLIHAVQYIFLDTFFRFGNLTSNIKVNSTFRKNVLFACTDMGLAVQKTGAVNLSAPESWNVFRLSEGLPSNKSKKVINYKDSVIVSTDRGLAYFTGSNWLPFLLEFTNIDISDIMVKEDDLFILAENKIYKYTNGTVNVVFESPVNLRSLAYSDKLGLVAASDNGVVKYEGASTAYIFPNGPQANLFPAMAISPEGTLWSASGRNNTGKGFYSYDGSTWTNYNKSNTIGLPSNDYYSIHCASDGNVYVGHWGAGFLRKSGERFDFFNTQNTDMKGIENGPHFLVITGFASDSRNNTWIMNWGALDRKNLSMLTPDSSWYHFSYSAGLMQFLGLHFGLVIDQYDTKWFYSNDPKKAGLYFFNEKHTYDNTADDTSGYLNSSNGLNSNSISALAVDRRGDVWVGTSQGVNIISNTNSIVSKTGTQLRISSVFALRQQTVNAIAVDPLNQKWIATNQGLLLVNSDGSRLLASFDTRNSALLSDIITSIAIDENSGRVYVGTDAGLTSFETLAIKPAESFTELFIYPNPFKIGKGNGYITIDGLIRDTDIKILNISGKLISEFTTPGGRTAVWDGRDTFGNYVNSGVYIVVAYDKDGTNVATGKVAILRE